MAFRRNVRIGAFWAEATREYEQRRGYWAQRSSGEQGAATLALARATCYVPLPPGFSRPYSMFTYLTAFGLPVYSRSYGGLDLADRQAPTEAIIAQRMLRGGTIQGRARHQLRRGTSRIRRASSIPLDEGGGRWASALRTHAVLHPAGCDEGSARMGVGAGGA